VVAHLYATQQLITSITLKRDSFDGKKIHFCFIFNSLCQDFSPFLRKKERFFPKGKSFFVDKAVETKRDRYKNERNKAKKSGNRTNTFYGIFLIVRKKGEE
jgi:hypothetical protein